MSCAHDKGINTNDYHTLVMSEFTAEVGLNGRIVIPIEVRKSEKIQKGYFVRLRVLVVVGEKK